MDPEGPVWAVVVAAGRGERFGALKQYEPLGDRRVLDWSLAAAKAATDGVVLVVAPEHATDEERADAVVVGGATRSASVRAGLALVPAEATVVVVHDAARPAASAALFGAVIAAVRSGADGAVPALPLSDTVKRVHDGRVVETLDRTELVAVQTPQAFRASALRAAHATGGGGTVVVVPGDPDNVKVTSRADLERLARVLA